ncbi:MAG TPA: glycosyltransferase, partial [Chthoniobacterales bacterium]|nr:glycosyltransferase [Chthoniobacterales bacterium]
IPAYCFYPDVSFRDHGRNISECLPLYGRIFTTKRFHQDDTALPAGVNLLQIVRHGFDPAVHRRLELSSTVWESYACDASFVGCWSPKKEALLQALIDAIPSLKLKVWGIGWGRCGADVRRHWTARGAFGDELAIVYGASAINLGLLSEAGGGTIIGDQVTARTWQIPAAAAFMLHEDTRELRDYFQPDKEVGVFADAGDLVRKVEYYLAHAPEREAIAAAGYARCVREDYTYVEAARAICKYHASQHPLADDS